MISMKLEQYVVGLVSTNCYLVINEVTKEGLIIDPGAAAKQLAEKIREQGIQAVGILLTHGHFDHASAAKELSQLLDVKIYAHEAEKETLETPELNLSGWEGKSEVYGADVYLQDEQELELAGFYIKVLHTSGHTVGSCCYYLKEQNVLFSGDTLFQESVGRTDFPKGSASALIRAIKEKLMVLPDETVVYTGHGDATEIGVERKYNPYLG